ncbi:hypothetical protein crov007 [Cafeteria roenbergensis virus]|uniref:Uncharacterized protein n=1 Tax=Cafeteria roenbergensis virus (strain BV-PW1) TaxID=693272 RepID=E3T4C7_CROVB|nr:hypothetical protein crov007 [Cafeteria roenbergensis virus BV-PW1]ADO67040.1 hypothetical protein crov007 [Cafeteria roenbergensis virus BV-PW1]
MSHTYNRSTPIKVTVDNIDRIKIPSKFYLPKYSENDDWKQFFHFKFSNNFEYYVGSNNSFVDGTELMTSLSIELDIVNMCSNPFQLKLYLEKMFQSKTTLKNAIKIYNWYKNKINKVTKIINQFMLN